MSLQGLFVIIRRENRFDTYVGRCKDVGGALIPGYIPVCVRATGLGSAGVAALRGAPGRADTGGCGFEDC